MASPFASLTVSEPIPLPFDEGQWIKVRKLTGRECDRCREAHAAGVSSGGARLWATKFRRILEGSISDKAQVEDAIADPLTGYDRFALVRSGLVAWSYPQAIKPVLATQTTEPDGALSRPVVASDAIEDLDDEAVDFFATQVLRLTKPHLFLTTEEDVATAQKELQVAAPSA